MLLNANPRRTAVYLLLFCLIVLIIPMFLRIKLDNSAFIGSDSYSNYRLANMIQSGGLVSYDEMSYSGREIRYEYGMPLLLSLSPKVLTWIMPIIFGIMSFLLFYFIVRKYDSDIALVSSLLLLFSPGFIYLFSISTKFAGAVFFCMLGAYFYLKEKEYNKYISAACFLAVCFFSIETALLLALIGLYFTYKKIIGWRIYASWLVLALLALYIQFGKLVFDFGVFFQNFGQKGFLELANKLFFDIGGGYGLGVFIFILALVGIYSIWHERYRYLLGYAGFALILGIAAFENFLLFFVLFLTAVLAAYGLVYLIDMGWRSSMFRMLTLIVVICGIIFSGISFLHTTAAAEPLKETIDAASYLRSIDDKTVVFSDYHNGAYITLGGKKNVADGSFIGAPELTERLSDSEKLLHARKIDEARIIIDKYNIRRIWIDKRMKEKYYVNDESELLFLLKYSTNDFYKVYDNGYAEIWGVFSER